MNPHVYTSHVGYLPQSPKRAMVSDKYADQTDFHVWECRWPLKEAFSGKMETCETPWGRFGVCDFSNLTTPGTYQVQVGDDVARSFPFMVKEDVYAKTFRMAFDFFHVKRCGVEVPGYHPACHLDDAVVRESGEQIDTTGGWHDAGDLRKWMVSSQFAVYAMLDMYERLRPDWNTFDHQFGDIPGEARWELDYHHKMQNPETGEVYHDTAGGVAGDNTDNHWTDNILGSGDERYVSSKNMAIIQWQFVAVQAKASRAFAQADPPYARTCREAALRCLAALEFQPSGTVFVDGWATIACMEMQRVMGEDPWLDRARSFADSLLRCQCRDYAFGQDQVRGFFFSDPGQGQIHKHHALTGCYIQALAMMALHDPDASRRECYADAVRIWFHDYIEPITRLNPFRLVPYGLYRNPLADGARCHPLAGELSYRYFTWREASSPEKAAEEKETFEHGGSSHILSQAAAMMLASRLPGLEDARQLALHQLEWIMGANPLAMCLMTGGGVNTPWPHSYHVGLIPGGILNGFIGHHEDIPFVAENPGPAHWQSTEYWLPHNANYLWIIGMLYQGTKVVV
ncbi:MAG: glycoside hydrolase family 9 protein [Candidatus Sumerlaeia bacterium]